VFTREEKGLDMTAQQLAQHLAALIEKTQTEGICIDTLEVQRFTPSVRMGVAYLGIIDGHGTQFLVEIEEMRV